MAPDHHEAIISHSDFEAANALVNHSVPLKKVSKKVVTNTNKRYAFSGKIICGECGDTFKRRIHYLRYLQVCRMDLQHPFEG